MEKKPLVIEDGNVQRLQVGDHLEGTLVDNREITPLIEVATVQDTDSIVLIRNGKPYTVRIEALKDIFEVITEVPDEVVMVGTDEIMIGDEYVVVSA